MRERETKPTRADAAGCGTWMHEAATCACWALLSHLHTPPISFVTFSSPLPSNAVISQTCKFMFTHRPILAQSPQVNCCSHVCLPFPTRTASLNSPFLMHFSAFLDGIDFKLCCGLISLNFSFNLCELMW